MTFAVPLLLAALVGQVQEQPPQPTALAQNLKRLSIEELAELDITSASGRTERLWQTAAAVSVVRQDDIRRTGVVSLAEAMRLADGLDVARFDGRTWAIGARGFNITTSNKLLVLMDGRTLYSPLFAGTFWEVQDTLLEDIDRIEVIRGPGGTIWGANAVNGVVNIITRDAAASRGVGGFLAAGNEERLIASARYGARLGEAGSYRVYGKFRLRDGVKFEDGADAEDDLRFGQGGFRMDSSDAGASRWTLQGDAYAGTQRFHDRDDSEVSGANLMGTWSRRFSGTSELRVWAYYDRTHRMVPLQFEETRDTFDLDGQHRFAFKGRNDLIVGGTLRVTNAEDTGNAAFFFDPVESTDTLFSVFAQDEIALKPDKVYLTVGSKFERNDVTGLEVQPTVRARWSPSLRQTLWGAVSRAVRLPTRFDTDLRFLNPAGRLTLSGDPDFDSESVVAYEAGYRLRPHARVFLDVATYVNRYDRLRSQEFPSRISGVVLLGNTLNATTSGIETAATVEVTPAWRLHGSYTYHHKDFSRDPDSHDISQARSEANDPSYFGSVRSYLDLPKGFALDGVLRYVGERSTPFVPAYAELDLRLGWMLRAGWEISVVGQNLLHDRHAEFRNDAQGRTNEYERGVYLRSTWRF